MRLIDADKVLEKLSRMIDYCKKDLSINGLNALFQVGDAIMDCETIDPETLPIVQELRANITIQEKIIESQHNPMDTDKIVKLSLENSDLKQQITILEEARENANEACSKWEHKYYDIEKQLKAAIMDMEALMWHSGEGCQICKHSIEVHKFPYVRLECKLGAGADCKPEWRYSDDHANK